MTLRKSFQRFLLKAGSALVSIVLVASIAQGVPKLHSPFFPGEIHTLTLETCEPVSRVVENNHPAQGSVIFTSSDGATLILTMASLSDPYSEHYLAQVIKDGIATPEVEVPLVSTVAGLLPKTAICQDLNGDGVTDFITDHSQHGNGFGASFYHRLVVLSSSSNSYRIQILSTVDPTAADYVTFGPRETIVMVTTSYARSGGAVPHSYYIYNLWGFRDGAVVLVNDVDTRFPKWVWMTFGENHNPATSLSKEEKRRMLGRDRTVEFTIDVEARQLSK